MIKCKCEYCLKDFFKKFPKERKRFCDIYCAAKFKFKDFRHNLDVMLDDSNESFYWAGFILADGTIGDGHKLSIELALKDMDQIEKFKKYIKSNHLIRYHRGQPVISISDRKIVTKIMEKFDIKQRKSYNPPSTEMYDRFDKEKIFCLIVGFIDGDGNIRKMNRSNAFQLTFENHHSWEPFYRFVESFLGEYFLFDTKEKSRIRFNNRGYVCMTFCPKEFLYKINNERKRLSLPVLDRKWKILDEIIIKP